MLTECQAPDILARFLTMPDSSEAGLIAQLESANDRIEELESELKEATDTAENAEWAVKRIENFKDCGFQAETYGAVIELREEVETFLQSCRIGKDKAAELLDMIRFCAEGMEAEVDRQLKYLKAEE